MNFDYPAKKKGRKGKGCRSCLTFLVGLLALSALTVNAANFTSQSFIPADIRSLSVSNILGITNLNSWVTCPTNKPGVSWTNSAGQAVVATGASTVTTYKQLTQDCFLWSDAAGGIPHVLSVDSANVSPTNALMNANIFIEIVGQSGANSAVTFIFTPLPDGVHESQVAGDLLTITATASGTTPVTVLTPIPAWKWPGCGKLRLRTITNADTDATSRVDVIACSLNGFIP